jgi:DNA-binding winged helix-turn-helix (wHTH) protein/TolB-like protein
LETTNGSKNGIPASGYRYAFGQFVVDSSNRTCVCNGETVPISGKAYDILLAFLQNPGRLLTKDELLERVWSDEFVEEGNLARNVSTLRKLLGDTDKQHRYITTVPGHGYRFVAEVSPVTDEPAKATSVDVPVHQESEHETVRPTPEIEPRSRKILWASAALIVLFTIAWFSKDRLFTSSPTVKSLAILPLRGIDPNDNYLGIGIADAVIRRLSASGQVTVRPTSAVLHYQNQDPDSLAAARELNTDAILEGNVQRSGDRLRVSVNLLKTADGSSIWNDNFDLPANDIFRVQDEVAREVADRLKVRLGRSGSAQPARNPANPLAYDWYIKGVFSLDQRGFDRGDLGHMYDTVDYFKHSIEADPNYALAHGQLAFSYAWLAMFVDPDEPKWVDLSRQEIARADELDPNLAEPHVAEGLLYWSGFGGHNVESAIKELRLAVQLDPNYSGADLTALYAHAGLEKQADDEFRRAASVDPTSLALRRVKGILPYLRGDVDAWAAVNPDVPMEERILSRWYYMHKGSLDLAEKVLDKQAAESPDDRDLSTLRQLLSALKGDFKAVENDLPGIMSKIQPNSENYHHRAFDVACTYALGGNNVEAVKWLRATANTGYPNYPLFAREPFLDRIRQTPEFIQFLAEQKAQWEHFEQEFPAE